VGRATALTFAQAGYAVVLAGRRKQGLDETAALIGGTSLVMPSDVTSRASVAALFDAAVDAFGHVDVLFNNAGISAPRQTDWADLTEEQWLAVLNTNVSGMFYCMQHAFRVMKAQTPRGGRIINNGSISAHVPRPNSAPYTATKHAVTGLTKSGSLDGRPFDIAVGQIDIGNAKTDMTQRMSSGALQADGQLRPEPTIDAELIARTVLHMADMPLEANIPFVTVMANKMPFAGRG
jgi:NAD(P)-dependent dehydrogenase (short-subunit alcohol dehydrogenase family)